MTAPRLLLGLGAAKSGTSWLYAALRDHPGCHLRAVKELHYFDTLHHGSFDGRLARLERKIDRLMGDLVGASAEWSQRIIAQIRDYEALAALFAARGQDDPGYLDYLAEGSEGAHLVADITPAYSLLPEAELRRMAGLVPDTRAIYAMRDPVARLWSNIRMDARARSRDGEDLASAADAILRDVLAGRAPEIAERSDYAGAVGRCRAAFAQSRFLPVTFGDMMSDEGFARICRFLDIPPRPAPVGQIVHAGPALTAAPEQEAAMAEWLAPQYEFLAREKGAMPECRHDTRMRA